MLKQSAQLVERFISNECLQEFFIIHLYIYIYIYIYIYFIRNPIHFIRKTLPEKRTVN